MQRLVEHRCTQQAKWQKLYGELAFQFKTDLAVSVEGTVADRLAKYLALVDLTHRLLREAIDLPWPDGSCADAVLPDVAKGAAPFDRPLEALRHCFGVAVAEKGTFFHCHDANKPPPRFNGYWRVVQRHGADGTYDDWDSIGFMPDYLERLLRTAGFDVEPTLKLWHQRGWLVAGSKEHRTHMVRLNGERPRVYAVRRGAVERALAG